MQNFAVPKTVRECLCIVSKFLEYSGHILSTNHNINSSHCMLYKSSGSEDCDSCQICESCNHEEQKSDWRWIYMLQYAFRIVYIRLSVLCILPLLCSVSHSMTMSQKGKVTVDGGPNRQWLYFHVQTSTEPHAGDATLNEPLISPEAGSDNASAGNTNQNGSRWELIRGHVSIRIWQFFENQEWVVSDICEYVLCFVSIGKLEKIKCTYCFWAAWIWYCVNLIALPCSLFQHARNNREPVFFQRCDRLIVSLACPNFVLVYLISHIRLLAFLV